MNDKQLIINDYSHYILNRFGERIQKISIDAGFTCPNRDGSISYGGCTYCNNDKFNPGKKKLGEKIREQFDAQVLTSQRRYKKTNKYIVYFQAYSNTYAPLADLKKLYLEALSFPNVIGLTIGTRPDCINQETIDFLAELASKYYITIEYGLESISDETLLKINRGHDFQCFKNAIEMTKNKGIHICTHIMFGFPWEASQEYYIKTAKELSKLAINYLKIHQLEIVKQTIMGNEYLQNPYPLITKHQYIENIALFLSHLSAEIVVQRVAGDCSPNLAIASSWPDPSSKIKSDLLDYMKKTGAYQGQNVSFQNPVD